MVKGRHQGRHPSGRHHEPIDDDDDDDGVPKPPPPEPPPPPPPTEPPPQPHAVPDRGVQPPANGNGTVRMSAATQTASPPPNIGGSGPIQTSASTSELDAVIVAQMTLITTQAVVVRDLETQLQLAPPVPSTPPPPPTPAPGFTLQGIIDTQTAAIRTQAAYVRHLEDLQTALGM